MLYFAQQCVNALQVSAFYGLIAVAYVLVHGITGRINLAFGAFSIWAGYLTINGALTLMVMLPGSTAVPVLIAVVVALFSTAMLGAVVARVAIVPLMRAGSLSILVASLGVAITLEEVMRLANASKEAWLMPILNQPAIVIAGQAFVLQLTVMQLVVLALAGGLITLLAVFMARHPFGRIWRACAEDRLMARLCGINVEHAVLATFAIASVYAGAAGVMLALHYGSVSFQGGMLLGLKALFVAIVGGLNSVSGAFAGALILGCLETFWSSYFEIAYRDVVSLSVLAGLMIAFPHGLFDVGRRADHDRD